MAFPSDMNLYAEIIPKSGRRAEESRKVRESYYVMTHQHSLTDSKVPSHHRTHFLQSRLWFPLYDLRN